MIAGRIFSIGVFGATNEMFSLVSIGVGPLYTIPLNFLTFNLGFHILGALVGSRYFVKSFMVEAFHEDFKMIFNFPMLADLQAAFAMFSLHYV
jgi:hypothetical protein